MRSQLRVLFGTGNSVMLLVLVAAMLALVALAILATPPLRIDTEFGGATVEITTDRSWVLLPKDCATVSWNLEGILSIYIDGQGKIGWGEITYCPSTDVSSPLFKITAENGDVRTYELTIRFLPEAAAHCLALLLLIVPFLIASFYLATLRLTDAIPLNASPVLTLAAVLLFFLLAQTAHEFTIGSLLGGLRDVFITRSWQEFGLVLAGFVFIPLALGYLKEGIRNRRHADFIVIGGFLVFALLLYLPFGFDSIGQYEEWINRAFLEGRPSRMDREVLLRFFAFFAYPLADAIGSDSFVGFHLLNFLMLFGKLTLFYVILRRLRIGQFFACVTAFLFMVYPVNSSLMSLRSFPLSLSMLTLLAGINLALDYRQNPGRLRLLAIWLALILTLSVHEIAFAIIIVIPLLWLWHGPRITWQNFNMTVIWCLVPVLKILYLLFLGVGGLRFYGIQYVVGAVSLEGTISEIAIHYIEVVANVYRQAFWDGWHEAINVMSQNTFAAHTLVAVGLAGIVMTLLAINSRTSVLPSRREATYLLIGGLFFILPSIGVGMWVDKYHNEFWRLYVYVPFGASIALYGVLLLLSQPIKRVLVRKTLVVAISLVLIFPAVSRLFVQHAHFVNSANAKAKILLQTVEQAPRYESNARVILLTDMSLKVLSEHGIDALWTHMFDSAIYLLYGDYRPMVAALCIKGVGCSTNDIDPSYEFLYEDTNYSNFVIFRLHDDLSVELLRELPSELGGSSNDTYNPERLIDTSAPIPPRALTMLASARRD